MSTDGSALAEGFYWYGEKLLWGYEDIEPDAAEALKFFRQAAELGFSDAYIRIGELHQHGKGVERDLKAALAIFSKAAKAGNWLGVAYLSAPPSTTCGCRRRSGRRPPPTARRG